MNQLRDPSIDAFSAMSALERDIDLNADNPLRGLAGIHLTTAQLQYDEGQWLECIESCRKGYDYLSGRAIKKRQEPSRSGVIDLFFAPDFFIKEVSS